MTTTAPPRHDVAPPRDVVTIQQLQALVARSWKPLLIGSLAGAIVGAIIVVLMPTLYNSSVRVWVRDAPVSLDSGIANQRNFSIDTEAQRTLSTEVARRSGVVVGPDQPVKSVTLTAPVNSKILQIRATAETPELAQQAATAIGDAYLEARRQHLITRRDAAVARFNREADRIAGRMVDALSPAARDAWQETLDDVIFKREQAASARTSPGSVIARASNPTPQTKNPTVLPVSLAIVGGAIALIVSMWRAVPKEARQ